MASKDEKKLRSKAGGALTSAEREAASKMAEKLKGKKNVDNPFALANFMVKQRKRKK